MCSETSPPRISFSHDLGQADVLPLGHNQPRKDSSPLDFNGDFEFSISSSFRDESSSAEELFSHGVILPKQPGDRPEDAPKRKYNGELAKHSYAPLPPLSPLPNSPRSESSKKDNTKEELVTKDSQNDSLEEEEQKPPSKSFWGFKRSSSLNQENKKGLLCSLQLLSRSNSTGSAPAPKKTTKDANKASSLKQASVSMSKSSSCSSSSSTSSNPYAVLPRPPSKKNGGSYYGGSNNGVRISPVLNVPSPYISRGTAKLFCLGSFLHPEKDQKVKK